MVVVDALWVLFPDMVLLVVVALPEGCEAGVRICVVVKMKVLVPVLICLSGPRPTKVEREVEVMTVWFG